MAVSIFSPAQVSEISCVTEQHGSETGSLKQTSVYLHFCKLEGRWRKQNFGNRIRWGKVKSRYQGNARLLIIYWNREQVYTINCRELAACGKHQKLLKNAFIMFFSLCFWLLFIQKVLLAHPYTINISKSSIVKQFSGMHTDLVNLLYEVDHASLSVGHLPILR